MKIKQVIGTVAVAAGCVVATLPAAGQAAAATDPTITAEFVGTDSFKWNYDDKANANCELHQTVNGIALGAVPATGTGSSATHLPLSGVARAHITCDGGVTSTTSRVYGPRDMLNDLRTEFNAATNDMFGS